MNITQKVKKGIKRLLQDENLWFKKVIPADFRHLFSRRLEKWVVRKEEIPKPYEPGRYPEGINLYGLLRAEMGLAQGAKLYAKALEEGGPGFLQGRACLPKPKQDSGTPTTFHSQNGSCRPSPRHNAARRLQYRHRAGRIWGNRRHGHRQRFNRGTARTVEQ